MNVVAWSVSCARNSLTLSKRFSAATSAFTTAFSEAIIAICTAVIALMQADSTVLVASLTGLVILLIPHADRDVAHALIETVLIKAKVVKQPSNEALIKFAGSARSSERHP